MKRFKLKEERSQSTLPVTNLLLALVFLQGGDFAVPARLVHSVLLLLLLHLLHETDLEQSKQINK